MASKASILARIMGAGNTTIANPAISSPAISNATLTAPVLGTPASGDLTNCTGVQYTGFKNRIINGGMGIWQRGTSISVGAATYTYTADRFKTYSANTATTVSRSTSVPTGFQYSLQLQRPADNTGINILSSVQLIETSNCVDLAGQAITLSFWVKKGANYSGGPVTVQVLTGTTADQGGDPYTWAGLSTAVNNTTYTPTTTWTKVTYTGTVASNVLEIASVIGFTPTGTAGADDSLYITGVQLEKGSTATSFDYRPYGTELQLCQRYFVNTTQIPVMSNISTQYLTTTTRLNPVPMRATPSLSMSGTWTFNPFYGGGQYTSSNTPSLQRNLNDNFIVNWTVGTSTGAMCVGEVYNATLSISAEL